MRVNLNALTGSRFIAALMVVFFHYGRDLPGFRHWASQRLLASGPEAVSYFFCLSGFIMALIYAPRAMQKLDVKGFYLARFARIYPVYLLAFLWSLHLWPGRTYPATVGLGALLLQSWVPGYALDLNGPAWSLSTEAFFYVVFPWLLRWLYPWKAGELLWMGLLGWVISQVSFVLLSTFWGGPFMSPSSNFLFYSPVFHFNTFLLGVAAGLIVERGRHRLPQWIGWKAEAAMAGAAAAWAGVMLLQEWIGPGTHWNVPFTNGMLAPFHMAIILGLALFPSTWSRLLSSRFFVFLGETSYGVYILQEPLHDWFQNHLLPLLSLGPTPSFYVYLTLLLGLSAAVFHWIERPLRAKLKECYAKGPVEMPARPPRIPFVDTLRAVGVLLVVWAHLGAWWLSASGNTSPLQNVWLQLICIPLHLYENGGHLGVLILFLVTGFIITDASFRETRVEFILKRVFRVWPTLVVAIALLPLLAFATRALHLPLILGTTSAPYFHGILLMNYFGAGPQILSVLWTVFIAVLFYAFTAAGLQLDRTRPLLVTWLMIGAFHLWNILALAFPILSPAMWNVMYLPYLLIGRCIYLGQAGRITLRQAMIAGVGSYLSFLIIYNTVSPGRLLQPGVEPVISQIYGVVIFLACSSAGLKTIPRFLAFVANISYPLYLIHAPVGGFVMFLLTKHGWPYEAAIFAAIAVVCGLAYVLNRWMEVPLQRIGRQLCARLGSAKTGA